MRRGTSRPTPVAADIAATEQINYWARIGMHFDRSESVAARQVLAVAVGDDQFSTLTPQDRTAARAVIDGRIAERVANHRFGPDSRSDGLSPSAIGATNTRRCMTRRHDPVTE